MSHTKSIEKAEKDEKIGGGRKLHTVRLHHGSQEVLVVSQTSPG